MKSGMTVDELEELLNERFEEFLESICDDPRFTRPVNPDYDSFVEETNVTFVYLPRGQRLVENFQRRLYSIAYKHFPDDEYIEIESHLYRDL